MATNTRTSRITAPTTALRLCRTARVKRRGSAVTSAPGAGVSSAAVGPATEVLERGSVAISGLSCAGVEQRSDEIREQDADQHGEGVEEEEPLHQRQVVVGRCGVEEIAETRI